MDMSTRIVTSSGLLLNPVGELLNTVNDYEGFMTGSSIIGGFTLTSDIDVVFPIQVKNLAASRLQMKCRELAFRKEESDYNGGYKLMRDDSVILNVVALHPFDYCAWLFATNVLKEQHLPQDKCIRHRAFELAVTLFKIANANSDFVTAKGASKYYKTNHNYSLMSQFEDFVRQNMNSNDFTL